MAFDTRYDVSTHVLSSCPAERLPAICGSATLAMLVSSTSMNVASVTVRAMIQGLTAGRHSAAPFMVIAAEPILISTGANLSIQSLKDSMPLFKPHLRHHRHPRTQFMPLVLARLEHDLHRYALHNFALVPARAFGWQQAEARSAGAGDGIDMPLVSLASRIDRDLSRQPS